MPSLIKDSNNASSIAIFLGIVLLVFLARSVYTTLPEMHDSKKKWRTASLILETNDPTLVLSSDHHSSRWGVIIPTIIALKINGKNLATYYSLTLLFYAVLFAIFILYARKDLELGLLLPFAVLLFYEPMFFRASSQIQPFVFGVLYLTLALWAISRYISSKWFGYLIISSFFAFCAYGTKETYLFFFPGLFLLLLVRINLKACFQYGFLLFMFLILETVVFNYLSGQLILGRIEFLTSGKHLSKMTEETQLLYQEFDLKQWNMLPVSEKVSELLLRRWKLLPGSSLVLVIVSWGFTIYLVVKGKLDEISNFSLGIILMLVSYSLFISIIPSSIDPLTPLQPLKEKYLTPLMPFAVFVFALSISYGISLTRTRTRKSIVVGLNLFAMLFLVYSIVFESPLTYTFKSRVYPEKSAMLWKHNNLNNAFLSGYGVCEQKSMMLVKIRNMVRNYMNEDDIVDKLTVSKLGNTRVLHHEKFSVDELTGFIPHRHLDQVVTRESCMKM
jgi:hypothetical protein